MAKNILQDIVPPEKRSIRNIPLPPTRRERSPSVNQPVPRAIRKEEIPAVNSEQDYHRSPEEGGELHTYESGMPPRKRSFSRKGIWIASGAAVLLVLFALSSLVSGATISVRPHIETASAQGKTFTATNDASVQEGVPFQIITLSASLGAEVTATGEDEVERKASGQITIYNDFDATEQRLIRNTRFETPEGLIYRINESVVVPGQKTGSNGVATPGSVTVTVYADEAGEKYNVGLKDFTIPGFAGDPRFQKMYARSETPMTGGFVGTVKTVSDTDQESTQKTLQAGIETQLRSDIVSQVPEGFMVFDDGFFFSFESLPQSEARGNSVTINEKGTLSAVMFPKATLASYLANELALSGSSTVALANAPDLVFSFENKETFSPERDGTFSFSIDGNIVFVSQFNVDALRADLAGKSKKEFPSILASYPAIADATETVRPFWKRDFPSNPQDIEVVFAE